MTSRLVLVMALALATPGVAAAALDAPTPAAADVEGDAAGRELLTRMYAGPTHAVAGTIAVALVDDDGPFVSELDVTATDSGEVVVGRSRSFAVGRSGDDAFLAQDGRLLRLGTVVGTGDSLAGVLANYEARHVLRTELETGPAEGVDLYDANGVRRERLWLDDASGVVVRRETFDLEGRPRRVVAFTELTLVAAPVRSRTVTAGPMQDSGPVHALDHDALGTLGRTGWHVPDRLPGDFELVRGFALGSGGDTSSLHLLYSDGFYSTSLYEQPGALAPSALEGAVEVDVEGMRVWRWPGAQPERIVWSADGMTFTVVGDATTDHLLASLAQLPRRAPDGIGDRIARGLRRVGSWLNPFA